ncbi:MAG: DUF5615 family PIN-like protein [Planctomycetaceae bacterium]|nr:DUF5615 family PIN-like protein [Planctomycetaceae bacterium]
MSVALYIDVHVDGRVTRTLMSRGHDVLRAQDDAAAEYSDSALLERATELARVMVTYDDDFLSEAAMRFRNGEHFGGLIFVRPRGMTIGQVVDQLEIIVECLSPLEIQNQIFYVPF